MARLVNQHGTAQMDSDIVAAAIRAASVTVGQVHFSSDTDPNIGITGRIIGKIAKEILEELRRN